MKDQLINSVNDILKSFNIDATCIDANRHRHFAFFDVKLKPGVKINDMMKYSREMQLELRSKMELSAKIIPELGVVRLQTVMDDSSTLHFEELYKRTPRKQGILPFLLGETDEGKPLWMEMNNNPHLLVAGCTGSGKSVFLHNLIANIAKIKNSEIFLIDPKLVEFNVYDDERFKPVKFIARNYDQAIKVLDHLREKMEKRYVALAKLGLKSIEDRPGLFHKTVLIVDEVSDLMLQDKQTKEFEELIVNLAQKARAAGIYIVLATQRPSVDVLTGLIKANFPARVSCKVASKRDSLIILDEQGAESLAGRGDGILKNTTHNAARFQVAFCDPKETIRNYKMGLN
jgi:DNA segregation ATPase FtsK/SpoIIIE, S-DNA-T family